MLVGKRFKGLSYIQNTMRVQEHDTVCQWKCECGTEITAKARDVMRGRKKSCTCYAYRKRQYSVWWTGIGDMPGSYWNNVKNNAKHRKISLQISQTQAWGLFISQNRKCAITGVDLFFDSRYDRSDGNASLDRIDSTKPYKKGNVQWVHKNINNMKKGLSQVEFVDWCRRVSEYVPFGVQN